MSAWSSPFSQKLSSMGARAENARLFATDPIASRKREIPHHRGTHRIRISRVRIFYADCFDPTAAAGNEDNPDYLRLAGPPLSHGEIDPIEIMMESLFDR